ncbi:hypothetical protein VP3_0032 [Vibrio phage VP3]|uniref:Host specificity protein A n=1 Tax=Vibrio phage VP3 TaxID=588068 RepID=H9YAI0_9CAUD|nr:hypothetical protein VP3_0032 [Vibrio phage VP3]
MSKFFVEYTHRKSGDGFQSHTLYQAINYHYCKRDYAQALDVHKFIRDFDRFDYEIFDEHGNHAAYFSLTLSEDMHLGKVASYIALFVVPKYRGNKEIAKLIKWYSERFAKTFGAKYIAKVKHVSPLKRIETYKEVK